jgi:hypothetical protein
LITLIFADRPEAAVMVVIRRGAASDSTRGFVSLDFTAMAQQRGFSFPCALRPLQSSFP